MVLTIDRRYGIYGRERLILLQSTDLPNAFQETREEIYATLTSLVCIAYYANLIMKFL